MPGIALAQAWRRRSPKHHALYVAGGSTLDGRLLNYAGVPWLRNTRRVFARFRPDAVAVTGGRSALPTAFQSIRRGVPLFVLEQNAIPGRANRLMGMVARRVYSQFKEARRWFRRPSVHSGSPMRRLERIPKQEARAALDLDPDRETILVLGGSQGSQRLNQLGPKVAARLGGSTQWLHVSGRSRHQPQYGGRARVLTFANDMATIYSAADGVISRAGATAIMEIAHFRLPAILVPFPHALDDHQRANARVLASEGAGVLLEENESLESRATEVLRSWSVEALRRNVARFARPRAAEWIAGDIEAA